MAKRKKTRVLIARPRIQLRSVALESVEVLGERHEWASGIVAYYGKHVKGDGMLSNRAIYDDAGKVSEIIYGDLVIVKELNGSIVDMTKDEMDKITAIYKYPEKFFVVAGEIVAVPVKGKWQ